MNRNDGLCMNDNVLTTSEWEALLTETPPRLVESVVKLAVHHGFRRGGCKLAAGFDHDAPAARVRD